jgi:CAP-Gly domain-containing linker protein 1
MRILDLHHSKLFRRQDELEREIERLKEKIGRYRASSKQAEEPTLTLSRRPPSSSGTPPTEQLYANSDDPVCEICGERGHDIVSCDVVFNTGISSVSRSAGTLSPADSSATKANEDDLWCNECEVLGDHITEDCPHSMDVF